MAQEIAKIDDPARKGQLLENKIKTYQVFGSRCNISESPEQRFNKSFELCIDRHRMQSHHWNNVRSQLLQPFILHVLELERI